MTLVWIFVMFCSVLFVFPFVSFFFKEPALSWGKLVSCCHPVARWKNTWVYLSF